MKRAIEILTCILVLLSFWGTLSHAGVPQSVYQFTLQQQGSIERGQALYQSGDDGNDDPWITGTRIDPVLPESQDLSSLEKGSLAPLILRLLSIPTLSNRPPPAA